MAYISKINLGNGDYLIKDASATERLNTLESQIGGLTGAMHFIGTSTTDPTSVDGANVEGISKFNAGDVVVYTPSGKAEQEYIYNGSSWQEFGSTGSLKSLAFKDSATSSDTYATGGHTHTINGGSHNHSVEISINAGGKFTPSGNIAVGTGVANYTPAGEVSQPTFTGKETTITVSGTSAGYVSIDTSAVPNGSAATYIPEGTISQPTFSGSTLTSTGKFTPEGTISTPTITVVPSTTKLSASASGTDLNTVTSYVASSADGGGSVTPGVAASWTYADETLTWVPGTPTVVSLPQFTSQVIATSIKTQPVITIASGVAGDVEVSTGINSASAGDITFTGTQGDVSVSGTPAGTVSAPTFDGTGRMFNATFIGDSHSSSVTYTPEGTISQPTFQGTGTHLDFQGTSADLSLSGSTTTTTSSETISTTTSGPSAANVVTVG